MGKVVECAPNFSEGINQEIIDAIVNEITSVEGVTVWYTSADIDYNRTCVAYIGSPEAVKTAAINSALKACELIDMRTHHGMHPRVGAADVIPFIPLKDITIEECAEIAREVAQILTEKINVPTYLYGAAALSPERPTQRDIQSTKYEKMFERIKEPGFGTDFGPCEMNEKYGCTMVGVRDQVVSMNFTLNTNNLKVAKKIAAAIRESSGGLKNVKAIGVSLDERNLVQVSVDDVNYVKTPIYLQYELIKMEAARYGTSVLETEVIGMIPQDALIDAAAHYLKLDFNFNKDQIIEKRLFDYIDAGNQ